MTAYCYAKIAVSFLSLAVTIVSSHLTTHKRMARPSSPGWLGWIPRLYTRKRLLISVKTTKLSRHIMRLEAKLKIGLVWIRPQLFATTCDFSCGTETFESRRTVLLYQCFFLHILRRTSAVRFRASKLSATFMTVSQLYVYYRATDM